MCKDMNERFPLSLWHLRLLHKVLGLRSPDCCSDATGVPSIGEWPQHIEGYRDSGNEALAAKWEQGWCYGPRTPGYVDISRAELHEIFTHAAKCHQRARRDGPESLGDILGGTLAPASPVRFQVYGTDERVIPRRPVTPTSVAMSAEPVERAAQPMPPALRERFMLRAEALGADEHRLQCDLAAAGETPETVTMVTATRIIRELEAERAAVEATP